MSSLPVGISAEPYSADELVAIFGGAEEKEITLLNGGRARLLATIAARDAEIERLRSAVNSAVANLEAVVERVAQFEAASRELLRVLAEEGGWNAETEAEIERTDGDVGQPLTAMRALRAALEPDSTCSQCRFLARDPKECNHK